MATDKRISELPAATEPLNDADLVEIVQGGVNKKAPKSAFAGSSGATIPFGATSGTTTLTATMSPTVTSYTNGDLYTIRAGATTLGNATLNLNSVGAKKIYETPERQISINDFVQGRSYLIQYDSALDTAAGGFIVIGEVSHEELMYRDAFDASGNAFPTTGGTGYAGAIRVGDLWRISVAGTLGGIAVADRDVIIALAGGVTLPGWLILYGHASIDSKLALKANSANSKVLVIACSDEVTPITAATNKVKFRMPYAMTVSAVRASLSTTQTSGSIFTVDINDSGTTILSTKLTIDNGETTSTTAATPAVISDTALADDAEISIDVDQIGDNTAKGLKVTLIGS